MGLAERTVPTRAEYDAYKVRLSNWGRWGEDDQLGTLNFITPEVRRAAANLVRDGRTVSCANPIATQAVLPDESRNRQPADHRMNIGQMGCGDYIGVAYHGFVNTHIDALCHIFAEGRIFNGRPADLVTEEGALSNSIDHWRDGIVTRGVLYDIPRLRGQLHVREGEPVEGWHLQEWAEHAGVTPSEGDAVLVRSGCQPFWDANPGFRMTMPTNTPGVGVSALEFLHETGASLLAWDFQEAAGQGHYGHTIPIHAIAIPYMGLPLLDNANFERLSEVCADLGRYEFLFTVAPLIVVGGTGSPVNPIATF